MTGHQLVLCDGPAADARAFRAAYARYLAACYREFLTLDSELPTPLRGAHGRVVDLVDRALAVDEGQLLSCFAAPASPSSRQVATASAQTPSWAGAAEICRYPPCWYQASIRWSEQNRPISSTAP